MAEKSVWLNSQVFEFNDKASKLVASLHEAVQAKAFARFAIAGGGDLPNLWPATNN